MYVYDDLRRRGLEFPMTDLDAMSPIHTPNRVRLPPSQRLQTSTSASARSHKSHSLQSIPENGSPEVSPDLACTQSAAQTPTSVPSQNAAPPIQPGEGPASLSPQQVRLSNVSMNMDYSGVGGFRKSLNLRMNYRPGGTFIMFLLVKISDGHKFDLWPLSRKRSFGMSWRW